MSLVKMFERSEKEIKREKAEHTKSANKMVNEINRITNETTYNNFVFIENKTTHELYKLNVKEAVLEESGFMPVIRISVIQGIHCKDDTLYGCIDACFSKDGAYIYVLGVRCTVVRFDILDCTYGEKELPMAVIEFYSPRFYEGQTMTVINGTTVGLAPDNSFFTRTCLRNRK